MSTGMSRPTQTTADYVVIALSPALIMLLVGSLVFLLLEVFYGGGYQPRLQYIFALFVFAAVLIARISMEEGTAYAAMFGAPLGLATALAMMRFVQLEGFLAPLGPLINIGLLALVWWCTHKLTWDCTLVDESKEASGEGLLQAVGLDRNDEATAERAAADSGAEQTIARNESVAQEDSSGNTLERISQWLHRRRRRPRANGLWVVYFSLAALPLFGIGQWFIPADDLARRRYVFLLLVVYLVSGLGLLVTTSLLSLRRYLRQRYLQMPDEMTAVWLGLGAILIVGVLAAAWLLPRRSPEYSVTQIPLPFTSSDDLQTSRNAVGRDGQPNDKDQSSGENSGGENGKSTAGDQSNNKARDKQSDDQSDEQQDVQGGGKNGGQTGGETRSGQGEKSGDGGKSSDGGKGSQSQSGSPSQSDRQGRQSGSKPTQDNRSDRRAPQSAPNPMNAIAAAFQWFMVALRWLFFVVMVVVAVVLLWRYRADIASAWRKFVTELRALWNRLFGGKPKTTTHETESAATTGVKHASFAQFSDPFGSGNASRMSPDQLIRYSFQALEAWSRDNGCPREPEQTPHEFVRQVAAFDASLKEDTRVLADLYCQVAYATGSITGVQAARLRGLWKKLRPLAAVG